MIVVYLQPCTTTSGIPNKQPEIQLQFFDTWGKTATLISDKNNKNMIPLCITTSSNNLLPGFQKRSLLEEMDKWRVQISRQVTGPPSAICQSYHRGLSKKVWARHMSCFFFVWLNEPLCVSWSNLLAVLTHTQAILVLCSTRDVSQE